MGEPHPTRRRRPLRRSNERHQWEKNRARQPLAERSRTGVAEQDTGAESAELVFGATYDEVPADADLAAAFGVAPGTPLLRRRYRTRHHDEATPFEVADSYLVRELVAANPRLLDEANEPWPGGTPHQLSTVGIEVARVVERITAARAPSREEAELLGLAPGVAVIELRKTCEDPSGRVVEVSDVLLPGDGVELTFVTQLEPWPS